MIGFVTRLNARQKTRYIVFGFKMTADTSIYTPLAA